MKQIGLRLGSLLLIAAFAVGCGVTAHVEKDPSVNLNDYKTFAWLDDNQGRKDRDTKPYNDFQEKYMKDVVSRELEKSGWRKVRTNADALIGYDILVEEAVRERTEPVYSQGSVRYFYNPYTRRINSVYYPSRYLGENNYAIPYKSGTITVNIVDTRSNNLIWQGWTETEITSRRLSQDDIDRAVKSIFKKFDVAKK